jgi:hypothetical protein
VLAEEYGSLRNLQRGNKSKRFKHHTCYERRKVYGMLACVSYDMHVSNGVMPINIQLEPLFEDKKKEQNVLKLFLLAFQEIPTILYIKNIVTRRSKALLTK